RDGAQTGYAKAFSGAAYASVGWPRATVENAGHHETWCSEFAVGLKHLLDLEPRMRSIALAAVVDSAPTHKDLAPSLLSAGYSAKAVEETWRAVTGAGWDATYKRAREYTAQLKGKWEGITNERYGAQKAKTWTPQGWQDFLAEADPERLRAAVTDATKALED